MTKSGRHDALAVALLTALLALPFVDVLAGYHSFYLRDVAQYYYPMKHVLREIVLSGEFPSWNPFISAGQPLAANPEHEVFYPLTWLILLPSYDLGFRLLVLLHVAIAGWTMYALIRSIGAGAAASFLTALSFALCGVVLSSMALLPILFVLAWLPLTCLFTRRFLRSGSPRDFALAAGSLGLQILAGEPTTVMQTGILLGFYALHLGLKRRSAKETAKAIGRVGGVCLAATALAAVLVLPALDHARSSVRARGFTFDTVTTWSMPPLRIGELAYPNLFGHQHLNGQPVYWGASLYPQQHTPFYFGIYCGLLVLIFAGAGLLSRAPGSAVTVALLAVSVTLAVGNATPLWRWLYDAGIVRSIRFPEKFILLGIIALIVFAGRSLDAMLRGDERVQRAALRVGVATAIVALAAALVSVTPVYPKLFRALWQPTAAHFAQMIAVSRIGWMVAALRAGLIVILIRNVSLTRRPVWLSLVTIFVLLDLLLLLPEIAPRVPAEYFSTPPSLAGQLPQRRGEWRLMHMEQWERGNPAFVEYLKGPDVYWIRRNAMTPMTPPRWGIRTILEVDYDLTSLQATEDYVRAVADVAATRPDWQDLVGSLSNVWYVASYADPRAAFAQARDRQHLQPVGLRFIGRNPRYFFPSRLQSIRSPEEFARGLSAASDGRATAFVRGPSFEVAPGVVRSVGETSNTARVVVETAGRSFLVMAVTPHEYWHVTLDGVEVMPVVTNVGFQGVTIPAGGRHVVEMRYRNPLIQRGAVISLLAMASLAVLLGRTSTRLPRP